ncbi:hypothetical protein BAUCODRAFT_462874 [Baudoinia panamericana UAMH 10762]|uniref:GYF domain-containing protein n=1 Tax=Baudoinia panamericana (strain UAMH 10762) TaxID=717646 RepID=M2MLZ0_BAUPA|nr:uncharacterized protein BAUCODRAFT_462874 [Baudoinia panamericana UAMH 10762]EMC97691.1 hypothetical protein BAUCODRAFT_462874 [Baudoinia panamericana UAMH 10762]
MATSAARPKRAGEDFARSHEHTSKKPRFDARNPSTLAPDAPEEDLILDADVIGKSGPQIKRNAVNIDGYESDSDNDNFDARAAERERRKNGGANGSGSGARSKDEEEDDMFADMEEAVQGTADGDEDEDLAREGKKKKKDVRFLDHSEIEGQVMNSKSGGHVSSELLLGQQQQQKGKRRAPSVEESSESGSDEERDMLPAEMEDELAAEIGAGGKKKHAPRLDAFNLRDEEEEGRFDESGNYVRKATDPDAVNDSWLDGLSKKDMRRAREAQEKRDAEVRRKAAEDDATLTSELLGRLIAGLETGETALEALQRLQKGKSKGRETKVPKWKRKKGKKDDMDVDLPAAAAVNGSGVAADPAETARKTMVDAITGAADALYSRGQHEIYDTERELLMRQYKRETGEDWTPPASAVTDSSTGDGPVNGTEDATSQWEYRWSDARDGGALHGPYDAATMKAWQEAGYFGEGVEFRRVGSTSDWSRVLDVS